MGSTTPINFRSRSASPLSRSQSPPINSDKAKFKLCDKIRNAEKELQKAIETRDATIKLLDDNFNLQKQTQIPCHNNLRKTVDDNVMKARLELDKLGKCAVRDCPHHTQSVKIPKTKRRHKNSSSDDDDNELMDVKELANKINTNVNTNKTPLPSVKLTPSKIDLNSINNEMQDSSHDELSDTDKDGFTEVNKRNAAKKRLISSHLPPPTPLSNPFSSLKIDTPGPSSAAQTGDRSTAPPPPVNYSAGKPALLMVKIVKDVKSLCQKISSFVPNQPSFTISGEYVKVQFEDTDDHRKATKDMSDSGIEYYIMNPPNSRPLKVVMRGLPRDSDPEEIKAELLSMGHSVEKVAQLRRFKDGFPLPIFQIQLSPGPNVDNIYKITHFQYLNVTVERSNFKTQLGQAPQINARKFTWGNNHQRTVNNTQPPPTYINPPPTARTPTAPPPPTNAWNKPPNITGNTTTPPSQEKMLNELLLLIQGLRAELQTYKNEIADLKRQLRTNGQSPLTKYGSEV
ncbi:hypothetical protein JTE90_019912 [Oedothorax gibbosus]|uniref:Pre-C2HC domain-containing protein n=1 Tax=Oedothorax gibbosus TaxID=931172 RepID=A0AAV6TG27_9ARAC|nr:hypothetical protein JTE90_019912 [Oedothorax gibbosus]